MGVCKLIPLPSLYDDQSALVQSIRQAARTNKSILACSPCGSGKTRMASWLAISTLNKGGTVIFDAPLKELRRQISNTFRDFSIEHSFISSGMHYNPFARAFISTSATLANRLDRAPRASVLFMDETHILGAKREAIINHYKAQGTVVIGLSASPERTDGQDLSALYSEMVEGMSPGELMNLGRLSGYRLFTPSKPDFSQLRTSGGEYVKADVNSFMEGQTQLIGDCVSHYKKLAMGKRHLVYACSVKHSLQVAEAFRAEGISVAHLDGTMDDAERTRIVKAFARREVKVLTSVDLLLAGFDMAQASGDPNAVIESMSDLRPTKSRPTQTQKIGRATRVKPDGSEAILIDHASNCFHPDGSINHGPPDHCPPWNWKGREKGEREGKEKTIPCRQCPVCFFVMRPTPACVSCGHVFEVKSRVLETVEGELVEVTREQLQGIQKDERKVQGQAKTLPELIELGRRKGVKNPAFWAKKIMEGRKRA